MAIDFKKIDRKKFIVLAAAVAAGIIALVLTNTYINRTVEQGSSSKEVQSLASKVQALEESNRALQNAQAALVNQLQEQLANFSQQQTQQAQPTQAPQPRAQSLAIRTPSGKRAITVDVVTLSAVGGLLNPGDFVDVLVHLALPTDPSASPEAQKTTQTTVTLFQNIQILAIGANVDNPADFEGQQKTATLAITFAVDPQQAELMTFAESHGKIQLVLRSPGEKSAYKLPSGNWETFTDYLEATQGVAIEPPVSVKKAEVKKESAPEIRVYRGGAN